MTRTTPIVALASALLVAGAGSAFPQEEGAAARYARTLQMVQDQIVLGSRAAHDSLPELRRRLAREIAASAGALWGKPQGVRVLAIHLLGGGATRLVRDLLAKNEVEAGARPMLTALAAFADRQKEAAELLSAIDARTLDAAIGGPFALAQAIASGENVEKAFAFLAQAKLLSPGGIVEEAALRREIELLLKLGRKAEAAQTTARYLWRFGASLYAASVLEFLAGSMIPELADKADGQPIVAKLVSEMPRQARRDILLSVARRGVIGGKLEIARFAGTAAQGTGALEPPLEQRARVYVAVAEALLGDMGRAAEGLGAIDRKTLEPEDAAILDATRDLVARIRSPITAEPERSAGATPAIEGARKALALADAALKETSR